MGYDSLGLFAALGRNAHIKDLQVVDANVSGSGWGLGIVAGINHGSVSMCRSSGFVRGGQGCGGVVGANYFGEISKCYSHTTVEGELNTGGLAGYNNGKITISSSFSHVSSLGEYNRYTGGLVGFQNGRGTVSNCYTRGSVNGNDAVGGLIGFNEGQVVNCYSACSVNANRRACGLIGDAYLYGGAEGFWDTETTDLTDCDGGIGLPTVAMQDINTYLAAGWDFVDETENGTEDIWAMPGPEPNYPVFALSLADLDDSGSDPNAVDSGMVAHWPFDETSGDIAEDIVGDHNGVVTGALWAHGFFDGALLFAGAGDYVACGNKSDLAPEHLTLAFWIFPHRTIRETWILGKTAESGQISDYAVAIDGSKSLSNPFKPKGPKLRFAFGNSYWDKVGLESSSTLDTDEWTHFALTRDGTMAAIYLNGKMDASANYSFIPSAKHGELTLGALDPFAWYCLDGRLDDVRLYNRALTLEDLMVIMAD